MVKNLDPDCFLRVGSGFSRRDPQPIYEFQICVEDMDPCNSWSPDPVPPNIKAGSGTESNETWILIPFHPTAEFGIGSPVTVIYVADFFLFLNRVM